MSGTLSTVRTMAMCADDFGNGIAIDGSGNIYVTGYSYGTWGTPLHPFDTSGSGNPDLSVLKLTSNGSLVMEHLLWLGRRRYGDIGNDIAVDGSPTCMSRDTATEPGALPSIPLILAAAGMPDIFVLKLTSSGSPVWNTFYGSGSGDGDWGQWHSCRRQWQYICYGIQRRNLGHFHSILIMAPAIRRSLC